MKSVVAFTIPGQELRIVPKGTSDPGLYMYRLMFLEYMSNPDNDRSREGLIEFSEVIKVPVHQIIKWKNSSSFQHLLARRMKDKSLGGMGLALAYEMLNKIISDPDVPIKARQKAATDLAKLSLKQDEMYLRYKMSKDRVHKPHDKKSFEDEVIEAEYEVIDD